MKKFIFILLFANISCLAEQVQKSIYYFDAVKLINVSQTNVYKKWDSAFLLAAVQGIVNREQPTLFVRFMKETDDFWWNQFKRKGEWLNNRPVTKLKSLEEVFNQFKNKFKGVIIYDGKIPATCNLASTIAGVEDRLPLRYDPNSDSIYTMIMEKNYFKDVKKLINDNGSSMFTGEGEIPGTKIKSTGSAKNDVYIYAKVKYIDKGLCSKKYMANYIDSYWLNAPSFGDFSLNCLFNRDIFISKKAFFYDLDPWEDEAPVDDPEQEPGTDAKTLKTILKSFNKVSGNKIFTTAGSPPWPWKYTAFHAAGKHSPVATEWHYTKIISSNNGVIDADSASLNGMANASFYQHYPVKNFYAQNRKPTITDLKKRGLILPDGTVKKTGFVLIYMGDYDSAAWMNRLIPKLWTDDHRGKVIGTWAFDPNLIYRAPHVFDYVNRHKSSIDWFMSGNSGAGYLNPSMLCEENRKNGLPDALDGWVKWNKEYFKKFDIDVTGFIIDGEAPPPNEKVLAAYSKFSNVGIIGQKLPAIKGIYKNMPFITMIDNIPEDSEFAGDVVAGMIGIKPAFLPIRTVMKTPSWHADMIKVAKKKARGNIEFVDPYTFFMLLKIHVENLKKKKTLNKNSVEWSVGNDNEVAPVRFIDGPFDVKKREKIISQKIDEGKRGFIYFQVAENFARKFADETHNAEIQVTLFDNKKGKIALQYNGLKNGKFVPYLNCGNYKNLSGSKKWKTLKFKLNKSLFKHAGNAFSDFRLVNFGTDLIIKDVKVIKKIKEDSQTFKPIHVENGILLYPDGSEVALFGVNYLPMSWFQYDNMKTLNADFREAVRKDVLDMKACGVQVVRVHYFESESCDSNGNLISNAHLNIFDILVDELNRNGIYLYLTPLAWWYSPCELPDAYSRKISKMRMMYGEHALSSSENFIQQLLMHTNVFTGNQLKDEPCLGVFEIINEPWYWPYESVTNKNYDIEWRSQQTSPEALKKDLELWKQMWQKYCKNKHFDFSKKSYIKFQYEKMSAFLKRAYLKRLKKAKLTRLPAAGIPEDSEHFMRI